MDLHRHFPRPPILSFIRHTRSPSLYVNTVFTSLTAHAGADGCFWWGVGLGLRTVLAGQKQFEPRSA